MEKYKLLTNKIQNITKKLRKEYYINSKKQDYKDIKPFGGNIKESIGPFPEFILKGRFCKRSLKGFCTPCFYSRIPEHNITDESFNDGYLSQVDFIIDNFDLIVAKNQMGKVSTNKNLNKPLHGIVCTPTGSYFDDNEYPLDVRIKNLKKMVIASKKKNVEIALHIETHVEDVLEYFKKPSLEELNLLKALNTRLILGFESYNDISRNILYGKNLSIADFERAIAILKLYDFPVGAFVFAGLFAYNDYETIIDVKETLLYLKKINVSPVIMFANTQKYTIPDVLMFYDKYKLLDAHTVLEISKIVVDIFGCDMGKEIDPWFIADPIGGPPDPNMHIFNSLKNTACDSCSKIIYQTIDELRITKDSKTFYERYNKLHLCECNHHYNNLIENNIKIRNEISLYDKIEKLIRFVEDNVQYYVLRENPSLVKAELLCYGLALSSKEKEIAKKFNPFINEKGLVHAVHIIYKGITINVCVAESFCNISPYVAEYDCSKKEWKLFKNRQFLGVFQFLSMPQWVNAIIDGKKIGELIRPHNENCLSLWPSMECVYIEKGVGCAFCGLNFHKCIEKKILPVQNVVKAISKVLDFNPNYEINLSGGTCESPENSIKYLLELIKGIKKIKKDIIISVECVPPSDDSLILEMYNAGATAIIMNIEIFNDEIRKKICLGKSEISIDRYLSALEYAVSIFGKGNVSSVIIMGIQPRKDIEIVCEELIKRGIIPTIMPFKPLDNSKMINYPLPNPIEYMEISRYVISLMEKYKLRISSCSGCASCGGCSLEINLSKQGD